MGVLDFRLPWGRCQLYRAARLAARRRGDLRWDRRWRRPIRERGLDEALGLAVGLGRIGPCPDMLEAEIAAGLGEGLRSVAGAVVGHDAGDGDAEAGVVGDRRLEEGDGALLVSRRAGSARRRCGRRRRCRHGRTPSRRRGTVPCLCGSPVMRWPTALEAAELLDVDMDHLAGMLALVASDRFGRLDVSEPRQSGTLENPADGGGRDADLQWRCACRSAAGGARRRCARPRPVRSCRGMTVGRDERSAMPALPSAL